MYNSLSTNKDTKNEQKRNNNEKPFPNKNGSNPRSC